MQNAQETQSDELTILASTFPLYEFAREIAPNENVQMIIPPGVDIHHYELKPSDVKKIDNADLIIYLGEDTEPWLESILDVDGKHQNKTLNAIHEADNLIKANHEHDDETDEYMNDEDYNDDHDDHDRDLEYDPHIWLNFENSIQITNAIASKLQTIKPENAQKYMQNANNYTKKLQDLHKKYEEELANCETRHFVVNHDAFRYLAKQYNLTQLPIRGLSAEQEPSPKAIENILQDAREYNVKHVFFEELASPRVSEALAKEIGAKTLMITPAGNIPKKDFREKTFIDMMRQNLENLKEGLRCE